MKQNVFRNCIYITIALDIIISVLFLIRLLDLHFSDRITLAGPSVEEVRRGAIMDRNGFILAMSVESWSMYANPQEVINITETVRSLSNVSGLQESFLQERIGRKTRFVWLKRKMDQAARDRIESLKLPGIYFRKEYKRVYPYGSLAANITGFTGMDNNGLEGIEYQYDSVLSAGIKPGETDAEFGRDITLTIDRFIQTQAQEQLGEAVRKAGARQGAAVIMDVKTGRLLAMARYPEYDPNRYYHYSAFRKKNYTVTDAYEPGSTMKVFSMAAAFEYSRKLFQKKFYCTGATEIGDTVINCERPHGSVTIREIISQSCNSGVIDIMHSVPKDYLYNFLKRFGFGAKTESGIPGEAGGILRTVDKWSGLSKYSISIGYELSVTSLQLAAAYAAIANGGVYNAPMIIEKIENRDGSAVQEFFPRSRGQVCSKETASAMMQLMRGTITGGTGVRAALEYYNAAGKTGTSRQFSGNRGSYSGSPVASFAGIVPAEDPALVMVTVIDSPEAGLGGGAAASPVFAGTMKKVLPYLGIKTEHMKARDPFVSKGTGPSFNGRIMPDFRNLSLAGVMDLVSEMEKRNGIKCTVSGTGRCFAQMPAPGSSVAGDTKVIIELSE